MSHPLATVAAIAVTFGAASTAEGAENYMIHRSSRAYEFIDGDQVKVVETGVREALVIGVNVGSAIGDTGYKVVARVMRFRCAARTATTVAEQTYSVSGQRLTERGGVTERPLRPTDPRDQARFRFVCEDDRKFSNYYDQNPVDAADKLHALLHSPE